MFASRRTSPETIARIRELFLERDADGTPKHKVEAITLELGVSHDRVTKYVSDLPRREPDEERLRLRAIELASLGCNVREIAERLGCPIATVRRALSPAPKTPDELEAEREAAYQAGLAKRRAERRQAKETAP